MNSLKKSWLLFSHHRFFLLVAGALLAVLSFLVFGRFLTPDDNNNNPYAFEIASAFLGTLLTIAVTAILLRHQTASEVGKERSVKIYETKLEIYKELLQRIEEILEDEQLSELEFFQLQLAFQKVVFIAGPQVLAELPPCASVFAQIRFRAPLLMADKMRILHAFGRLAAEIRADLHAPAGAPSNSDNADTEDILAQMEAAFNRIEPGHMVNPRTRFLEDCSEDDRKTYEDLFATLRQHEDWFSRSIRFEPVGFTVRDDEGKILMHVHPECAVPNKIFKQNLSPKTRDRVEKILKQNHIYGWHFRTRDFHHSLPTLVELIQHVDEKAPTFIPKK